MSEGADPFDFAAELEESARAAGVAAVKAAGDPFAGPPFLLDPQTDEVLCWTCMEPLTPERLAAKPRARLLRAVPVAGGEKNAAG